MSTPKHPLLNAASSRPAGRAFSLVEALVTISVLAILATGAFVVVSDSEESVSEAKLEQDVGTLNRALKIYAASGGRVSVEWDATDILRELKSSVTKEEARRVVGLSGSLIDPRLGISVESVSEAGDGNLKAWWNPEAVRFELTRSADIIGIRAFVLDERLIVEGDEESERTTNLQYASKSPWVWDYAEDRSMNRAGPMRIPQTSAPPTIQPGPGSLDPVVLNAPSFSHPVGDYDFMEFDLPVSINGGGNTPGTFEIVYALEDGAFRAYADSPVPVEPGVLITAYARSLDEGSYVDSPPVSAIYGVDPVQLLAPEIATDYDHFDALTHPLVAVSLSDPNNDRLPRQLRYRIEGGQWRDYTGSFQLDVADYPQGAQIETSVVGQAQWVIDSEPSFQLVRVKLQPPVFSTNIIDDGVSAQLGISNPNPPASSSVRYRFGSLPGANLGAEQAYSGTLDFDSADHPNGVRVVSRAKASTTRFLDSDEATLDISLAPQDGWAIDGNAHGQFAGAQGGRRMDVDYSNGRSTFSWGTGTWPYWTRSTTSFAGEEFSSVRPGDIFKVGRFDYFNGAIVGGTGADEVTLSVGITFGNGSTKTFQVPLELINVPNNTGTEEGDADFVRIRYDSSIQTVRLYGKDYRVIVGFGSTTESGFASVSQFHVFENESASAELFATIVDPRIAETILAYLQG